MCIAYTCSPWPLIGSSLMTSADSVGEYAHSDMFYVRARKLLFSLTCIHNSATVGAFDYTSESIHERILEWILRPESFPIIER